MNNTVATWIGCAVMAIIVLVLLSFGKGIWALLTLITAVGSLLALRHSQNHSWLLAVPFVLAGIFGFFLLPEDNTFKLGVYSFGRMFKAGLGMFCYSMFTMGNGGIAVFLAGVVLFFFAYLLRASRAMWVPLVLFLLVIVYWGLNFVSPTITTMKETWKQLMGFPFTIASVLAIGVVVWMILTKKAGLWRLALLVVLILVSLGAGVSQFTDNLRDAGAAYHRSFPKGILPDMPPEIKKAWSALINEMGSWKFSKPTPPPKQTPGPGTTNSSTTRASVSPAPAPSPMPAALVDHYDCTTGQPKRVWIDRPGVYTMKSSTDGGILLDDWTDPQAAGDFVVNRPQFAKYGCMPPCSAEIKRLK